MSARAARVEEHVALADATASRQQPRLEQRLADRLGERALVAGEAAREVRELRVVAAPLPHPVEPLEDPPRDAPRAGRGRRAGAWSAAARVEEGSTPPRAAPTESGLGRRPPSAATARPRAAGGRRRSARAGRRAASTSGGTQRAGSQAVDARQLAPRRRAGRARRSAARGLEGEAAVELAREQALGIRAGRDERADERGDQGPRPVVDGGRVGAQLRRHRRDRRQPGRDGDRHGTLVAGALAGELLRPVVELGGAAACAAGPARSRIGERLSEVVHRPYRTRA